MAESQMQNYEEFRQKEDVTYEEIKTTTEKTKMNPLVVKKSNQWLKQFLLILLISVISAAVASTITYLTVCGQSEIRAQLMQLTLDVVDMKKQINESTNQAQFKQFTLDLIEKKLKYVERKSDMKDQEMEKRYNLTSSSLQKQITDSTDTVGFTAFGSGSSKRSSGYQLKFPVIKSSVGISNLSSMRNNGTFICEKKGLYVVIVTVMVCSKSDSKFYIYKNNQLYMDYYIGRSDGLKQDCHSGTGTAVVELRVKDTLYVQNVDDVTLYENWSSFSAVKLK